MSAKRRLAKAQLRQMRRDRMADPEESALHQFGLGRMIVKAIRNRRARKAVR